MRRRPFLASIPLAAALSVGALATLLPQAVPNAPSAPDVLAPAASPAGVAAAGPAAPEPPPTPEASPAAPPTALVPPPTRQPGVRVAPVWLLQARLDRLQALYGIPGVSVTVLWSDGRRWTGTSGLADVRAKTEVAPDTAFAVASISKTFLAALVLQLVDEGRLGLDDPLVRHLPEQRLDPEITVRRLLDHTSGLHDYFLNPKIDRALQSEPDRVWTAANALRYVRKPYFEPGTGFQYSNTNYLLLGLVAERVTDRSVAEELRERFLDPLGLKTAFYQVAERPRTTLAHGYRFEGTGAKARPIDLSGRTGVVPFRSVVTAAGPAGSLAASSADVARWAQALYGGEVLGPASLAAMVGGAAANIGLQPRIPYGLGIQELPIGRWWTYGHSGRFLGSRAVMRYLPEEGIAIAVLTNQSRTDPGVLVTALLDAALPVPAPCSVCR